MAPKPSASAEPTERRVSSRIAAQIPKPKANSKASAKDVKAKKDTAENSASTTKRKATSQPKDDKSQTKPDQGAKKGKATPGDAKQTEEPASTSTANGKKQLSVGDALPGNVVLNDEAGSEIRVSGLKKAVIFMYPKANTGGCTKQGQCYRDEYSSWQALGFSVYGLSNDNPIPLKNWKEKHSFPYTLISDPQRKLISALTGNASKTIRSHAVIDSTGHVADIALNVSPGESSKSALEAAKNAA